jgi:hypothetical protein
MSRAEGPAFTREPRCLRSVWLGICRGTGECLILSRVAWTFGEVLGILECIREFLFGGLAAFCVNLAKACRPSLERVSDLGLICGSTARGRCCIEGPVGEAEVRYGACRIVSCEDYALLTLFRKTMRVGCLPRVLLS